MNSFFRCLALSLALSISARADQIIFDDALENGWQNWGWAQINYNNTSPVHSGTYSISVTITNNTYQALYIEHSAFSTSPYASLSFWINGGATGGQQLQVEGLINGSSQGTTNLPALATNAWQHYIIPLSAMGVGNVGNMDGLWIQSSIAAVQPTFYVDDISLIANPIVYGTNAPITITVNALSNRLAISPQIYGTAFAVSNQLSDLNFTMNRSGGNNETRYNWLTNAHNLDFDYYFESYPDATSAPGSTADTFVATSKSGGAQPMITVPMIGWSPKLGPGRSIIWSYSVAKYGPQTSDDKWRTDAGNGISVTNNTPITWNDPTDANFQTGVSFQQGYVQHLITNWGVSTNGGVGYYLMDNEHSLWSSTHQDVHPIGPTMQEILEKMLATASMVKSNDPNALILGPEEWGWPGYFYSGYDQQWSGSNQDYNSADYPDRKTNGGWDYIPWLLNQFAQYNATNHQRLLDYVTAHCYPQESDVSSDDVSPSTALLRNQTTRVFWDTNYVDPSWINAVIELIPRLKQWANTYYPGTKTGITEYNWGAETNINGATAQADILGIFGRQGLDLATRWTTPAIGTPTYLAMKLYRNYDGQKSTFGDTSIQTVAPNPDGLSAFGAVRSLDGALTLMVINKDLYNASPFSAPISNFLASGTAQRWQLTSNSVITQLSTINLTNSVVTDQVPAQSITLYVLPALKINPFNLQLGPRISSSQAALWINGQSNLTYVIQSSTNLLSWLPYSTNTLLSNSLEMFVPTTNSTSQFYRGVLTVP